MRIGEICTRHAVHIAADATVRDAAETMRKRHVGSLVVVEGLDGERVPAGVLTDRDIAISVVAAGVDPDTVRVADVMTRHPATCGQDQDVRVAIRLMRERGIRRLPVVDATGALAGVLTADDIYGALALHMHELSQALVRGQVREMEVRT